MKVIREKEVRISSLPYRAVNFQEENSYGVWFDYAEQIGLDGVELMYGWLVSWPVIYRTQKQLGKHKLAVSMIIITMICIN